MTHASAVWSRHVTCASLHLYLDMPPPSVHHRTQARKARLARWSEEGEEEQTHQHTCSGLATIGGQDAATAVLIASGSISRVRARRGRRRLGGIASAVDGKLTSKRRVPSSPQGPVGSTQARYRWTRAKGGSTDAWMGWS